MPKRHKDEEESQRPPKRAKPNFQAPVPEQIHFARQLQDLLSFRQDGIQQLRHGIASFKPFLESIRYHKDEDDRARQLSILREYLESQKPADVTDTESPFLSQLWQAWSYASQNNDERLASSISSITTSLLKTLSTLIDFREYGLLLCRTVLQHQHLRLVKRDLDAPKHKEFLISPVLRLLTEVVSFDGGVLAKEVYKRREYTFLPVVLRRNLGFVRTDYQDDEDARRRPAIRTLTIRYILAHLKYLHEGGKIDVLAHRPLCSSLFHFLRDDPAEVINELLSATEQHVLKDSELSRSAKSALLTQHNLECVTEIATRSPEGHAAADRAFSWLTNVCENPSYGALRASGWYPPGTINIDRRPRTADGVYLGLASIDFYDRDERPNVRNTTLLEWIQTLRPHSNLQERELTITCFKSTPELVATYFAEKNMQLEPKLSNTWIGYASFLFEVVQLPIPKCFRNEIEFASLPPQTDIMMESILPRPLTQKVLTRCLNQSSELITFFAVRLLVLAFEKISRVRSLLIEGAKISSSNALLWREASGRLLERFVDVCPAMKDAITAFQKIPDDDDHALQREAVTRLLQLYHEITPIQASEARFDISIPLTKALAKRETEAQSSGMNELRQLELEHLLKIAQTSPGIRWFTQQGSLQHSPILSLMKVHSKELDNRTIRDLIFDVLSENDIIKDRYACDALFILLRDATNLTNIGPFLDDCMLRAARHPVKYLDLLEFTLANAPKEEMRGPFDNMDVSMIALVFLEQAPFVLNKPEEIKVELHAFMSSYFDLVGDTPAQWYNTPMDAVSARFTDITGFPDEPTYHWPRGTLGQVRLRTPLAPEQHLPIEDGNTKDSPAFAFPPAEAEDHPELHKWSQKDLVMAVDDGNIDDLILCLCSQHPDIRTQALAQLNRFMGQLLHSNIEDKEPVQVLIGELIETYGNSCAPHSERLPHLAACFATHALHVQTNPSHFLYPKINKFLNRGPSWRITKLPNYWIENTILSQPSEDDAYWNEVQWVLDWLVDGMRASSDLEILRKTSVFEKVMALYSSPGAARDSRVRMKVLELLWRVTFVEGGSTTLITRTGVLAWLDAVRESLTAVVEEVRKRVLETCDRVKVEEWSGLKLEKL